MKKQIEIYKENIVKKKEEEGELQKVLKEYSERFKDFDKSTKQSRKTLGTYEKEIGNMNRQINKLKD
jgi:septal ring factor EnvC (AmiA/AmiB activator)